MVAVLGGLAFAKAVGKAKVCLAVIPMVVNGYVNVLVFAIAAKVLQVKRVV